MSRITIFLLNCIGPNITVNNDSFGRFQDPRLKLFIPCEHERLLTDTKQSLDPLPFSLRLSSERLHLQRMKSCRTLHIIPPKINSFQILSEKINRFDNTRNWFFEADNSRVLFQPIPSKTNKRSLISRLSPHEWNSWCETFTDKFTGVPESPSEMHCSNCGMLGHTPDICWMNLKSQSEMQLANPTDKDLCNFLSALPRAKPLIAPTNAIDHQSLGSIIFKEISNRARFFKTKWIIYAKSAKVPHSLFVDTFSQIRSGLPFWYALGASKLQLQWGAKSDPLSPTA